MTAQTLEKIRSLVRKDQVLLNEPMAKHCSFQVGGPAAVYVEAETLAQLTEILAVLKKENAPYLILGKGTNLLVADSGLKETVIRLTGMFEGISAEGTKLRAMAGCTLARLAKTACECGLSGLEFAAGIPGTVGGALVMNAGAYDGEMKDVVEEVTLLFPDGEVRVLSGEEMAFGYRKSILKTTEAVALEAVFSLAPGSPEAIREKMETFAVRRKEKQPLEYPSAGSTFKRPPGNYAGALIEAAGCRGLLVGGAQVSEKHCGFVINKDKATAKDIYTLIRLVQQRVREDSGILLEPEVVMCGGFEGE